MVVLEDTSTSGGSALAAVEGVRNAGAPGRGVAAWLWRRGPIRGSPAATTGRVAYAAIIPCGSITYFRAAPRSNSW